jgi:hypothetical protein
VVIIQQKLIIGLFVIFFLSLVGVSAQDYLALQGSVTGATTGDVQVQIYSAPTGGVLLYDSSTDFASKIIDGRYDILVGNSTHPLSLNFSQTYYMNLILAGKDMDFGGNDRQVFQSPVGNISVEEPIKTSSTSASALNVNDKFTVSGTTGGITTSDGIVASGNITTTGNVTAN